MNLLFLDTETGGLDCLRHPIVSLGALVAGPDGAIIAEKEWIICDPELDQADPEAMKVHGISVDVIRTQGYGPLTAVLDFRNFVTRFAGDSPHRFMVVGQNIPFDFGFIDRLFGIAGFRRKDREDLLGRRPLDTISVARFLQLLGLVPADFSCALSALRTKFAPDHPPQIHGALADCNLTKAVLEGMLAHHQLYRVKGVA